MDYPYRLGEEVILRGVAITEVKSADNTCVFGTIRRQLHKGTNITAVSSTGKTLGDFKKKVDAAKAVAKWGVENVEGRY